MASRNRNVVPFALCCRVPLAKVMCAVAKASFRGKGHDRLVFAVARTACYYSQNHPPKETIVVRMASPKQSSREKEVVMG